MSVIFLYKVSFVISAVHTGDEVEMGFIIPVVFMMYWFVSEQYVVSTMCFCCHNRRRVPLVPAMSVSTKTPDYYFSPDGGFSTEQAQENVPLFSNRAVRHAILIDENIQTSIPHLLPLISNFPIS